MSNHRINPGRSPGTVVQIAGPAIGCQFPEGQIPEVRTAAFASSAKKVSNVPNPIDIICRNPAAHR